ncbi:uncharacterized protein FIBRA_07208 [Fibroporia radiculosa]|uniref:Uncharacterized protein n=1 Tax=Fibroporia radiculosa TaxID=599839 RepID=J4H4H6_9APHY|nr:uncharacterized protein FIBRA_07208 [Fibroporia radiculosa]CCM05009.1 predicted protein [Fibroporia radiculosa]
MARSTGLTFWGLVGATMVALKLKENWGDYQRVSPEEGGVGPVALHSPVDDDDDAMSTFDTSIPTARPKRKRDCCVCCGLRCGLFWKAFGIVCLLFVGWNAIKFVIWMVTPSPTGLEGMPQFSSSLGCSNAVHIYNGSELTYAVPFDESLASHSMYIDGTAVGTVTFVEGGPRLTEIGYQLLLRSSDAALLDSIILQYPTESEVKDGLSPSRMRLTTPPSSPSSCMRYDLVIYVPPALKQLEIQSNSVTQLQFNKESVFDLNSLTLTLAAADEKNMILPHQNVRAGQLSFELTRGWLVGDVAIVDKTSLSAKRGDATMNVHVHPVSSAAEPPAVAELVTTTGSGRTDVFYINDPGFPHRPINSMHRTTRSGDVYLTYKQAEFRGTVDLQAKSYSATGLQNSVRKSGSGELPWVGDKDGGDNMVISSPNSWVGLYF